MSCAGGFSRRRLPARRRVVDERRLQIANRKSQIAVRCCGVARFAIHDWRFAGHRRRRSMTGRLLLKTIAWGIAISLVLLPVVGVLNGWFAADRWPVRYLRVDAEFNHVSAE